MGMRTVFYTLIDSLYHILITTIFYNCYYKHVLDNFPWMMYRLPRFQFVMPLHRDYITISYFRSIAQIFTLTYIIPYLIIYLCGDPQYRETREYVYIQIMTIHMLVISYIYTKTISPYKVLVKRLRPHYTFTMDILMYVFISVLNFVRIKSRIVFYYCTFYFFQAAYGSKNWLSYTSGKTQYWLHYITHTNMLAITLVLQYGTYVYLLVQAIDGTDFWIELLALVQIYCRDASTCVFFRYQE